MKDEDDDEIEWTEDEEEATLNMMFPNGSSDDEYEREE